MLDSPRRKKKDLNTYLKAFEAKNNIIVTEIIFFNFYTYMYPQVFLKIKLISIVHVIYHLGRAETSNF